MGGLKVKKDQSTDLLQCFHFRSKAQVAYSGCRLGCNWTKPYGQEASGEKANPQKPSWFTSESEGQTRKEKSEGWEPPCRSTGGRTARCRGTTGTTGKLRKVAFNFSKRERMQLGNSIRAKPAFPKGDAGGETRDWGTWNDMKCQKLLWGCCSQRPGWGSREDSATSSTTTLSLGATHSELPIDSKTPTTKARARGLREHTRCRAVPHPPSAAAPSKRREPASSQAYPHPSWKAFRAFVTETETVLLQKLSWKC